MKKKKLVFAALLLSVLFLFGSCYTKRKGIVPCPHGYNEVLEGNVQDIPTEPA